MIKGVINFVLNFTKVDSFILVDLIKTYDSQAKISFKGEKDMFLSKKNH